MLRSRPLFVFLVLLLIITFFYWQGTPDVPFHPDESTYLFMSGDADLFWRYPGSLFWQPDNDGDIRQRYRLLDAPILRNLIALSRWMSKESALPLDWDWGKTWGENKQYGSLPSIDLLLTGRRASDVFFPFTIILIYLATRKIAGEIAGWTAAILLAGNALVLLHTRRAMAEGPLLFSVSLTLWSLISLEKQPWLNSIPTILAFCTKQSLAALAPAGLLAVAWPISRQTFKWLLLFVVISLSILWLLYPVVWAHPTQAIASMLKERQALAARQTADRPEQLLITPADRLAAMLANLYFTPPAFSETANYNNATRLSEQKYLANPLHSLFRSIPGGAILLILNLFGFLSAILTAIHSDKKQRRRIGLLITANLFQVAAIFLLIPLPWQRYYIPLVPFVCLWTAFGVDTLYLALRRSVRRLKERG